MRRYREKLPELDEWFSVLRSCQSGHMHCGRGCAMCCCGLFDISLPDSVLLATGLNRLDREIITQVKENAAPIQEHILEVAPELKRPFLLDRISEDRIDEIVDQAINPPCPLLGKLNDCVPFGRGPDGRCSRRPFR